VRLLLLPVLLRQLLRLLPRRLRVRWRCR